MKELYVETIYANQKDDLIDDEYQYEEWYKLQAEAQEQIMLEE